MRLFLVRHGESVDNVAGLYAGSRDSSLTAHGVLQARRLAEHLLARRDVHIAHVLASDLERAAKTAWAVADEWNRMETSRGGDGCSATVTVSRRAPAPITVVSAPELREKHFGASEGVRFGMSEKGDLEGAESPEAMKTRATRFINDRLWPLLSTTDNDQSSCIIVAHGIILGVLFRALCNKAAYGTITVSPEVRGASPKAGLNMHILPSWSNTGFVEATVYLRSGAVADGDVTSNPSLVMHVLRCNCLDHLKGLRKTRGGIGSAQFDEKQRTMDSFFSTTSRKRKLAEVGK